MRRAEFVFHDNDAIEGTQEMTDTPIDNPTVEGVCDRRRKYIKTGDTYEHERYGEAYMQLYFQMRTSALVNAIRRHAGSNDHLNIAEIGCGTGVTLEQLAKHFQDASLTGMDISQVMLQQALEKKAISDQQCLLVIGSVFCMPFPDNSFDVAYSTRFIHQFEHEEKRAILSEISRVVKPGGLIVTEFYSSTVADWIENTIGSKRHKAKDRYQMKFPSRTQVLDLVGDKSHRVPLSVCGARYWQKLIGKQLLHFSTNQVGRLPLPGLINEYFILQTNS